MAHPGLPAPVLGRPLHERAPRQSERPTRSRHHRDRWQVAGRAQGLDDHPGRRQGPHLHSALLLPPEAAARRQLPHGPGGRGEVAEAGAGLRHSGDGRHEGRHPQRESTDVPALGDGVPAHQPPAGLPDL
ncbi:hypothetical protein G6F66_014522 [Rhizopus arrhizus]|nr:hypothetical protein G6F66_014522 [Rhizopus arrhizus]